VLEHIEGNAKGRRVLGLPWVMPKKTEHDPRRAKENESSLLECAVGTGWRQAGCVHPGFRRCGDSMAGNKRQPKLPSHGHRRGGPSRRLRAVLVAVPRWFWLRSAAGTSRRARRYRRSSACPYRTGARRANFHMQRLVDRRAGRECVATTARDLDFAVIRMNPVFINASIVWRNMLARPRLPLIYFLARKSCNPDVGIALAQQNCEL